MKTLDSDRVNATKPCQANCQIPAASIITQLEEARNQIHTHSGEVENSVDVWAGFVKVIRIINK